MKASVFVLGISLWIGSVALGASDPSQSYRYFSQYDAVINLGNVSYGQAMPERGSLHFLVGLSYPLLPQRATLRSAVTTLDHDVDISSDDEYACLTTAEFPPLQQTYFLLDGATHELVAGDRLTDFRVSHSTQGAATSVLPSRCESNLSTGPLPLSDAQAHGRSIRMRLADGAELVLTPFYDGLWFDGTIEGGGRTEARLTRFVARGSTPQRLHWGLHLPGSTSGYFAAGGFVTMRASPAR